MNKTSILAMFAILAAGIGTAQAGAIELEISGFRSDDGQARIVLMSGTEGYHGITPVTLTATAPVRNGTAVWRVENVPDGDYALIAHHDRDVDDSLDRPVFGLPLEPYGYSNGAWTSFGLPGWDAVSFSVGDGTVHQHVHLRMNAFALAGRMVLAGLAPLLLVLGTLAAIRRYRRGPGKTVQVSERTLP